MFLNYPYKVFNIKDFLSKDEITFLDNSIENFCVSKFSGNLSMLLWDKEIESVFKLKHPLEYDRIVNTQNYTETDFKLMVEINKTINNTEKKYFNFRLSSDFDESPKVYDVFNKVFQLICEKIYEKKIKNINNVTGIPNRINVYPNGSFLMKHQDGNDGQRIFTMLFFVNKNWNRDEGSLFRLYNEDSVIEVIPNYENVVILEHINFNLIHEVTKNISNKMRYSVFCPFTINDYNQMFL
jgi:hypothetical protein